MARRVFFSFHFQRDAWRANQIRHSWITKPDRESAGFFDEAEQEEIKRATDEQVRRWIDDQLERTTVTAILIGEETASRKHVQYEIEKSFERGNALLGIRIHQLKNRYGETDRPGANPLEDYALKTGSGRVPLFNIFPTYDWKVDNGNENIGQWVEEAYQMGEQIPLEQRENLVEANDITWGEIIGGLFVLGLLTGALEPAIEALQGLLRRNQF